MMNELANRDEAIRAIAESWETDRFVGVERPYTATDVFRLRGSLQVEYTIAKLGAEKLWRMLNSEPYVPALGALTGNQAVQMVQAGLKAIYLSGWQVAADGNLAGQMYPDQSLYPSNSVPAIVKRINQAFQRADQMQHAEGSGNIDWFAPIVADAEAGFGGPLNVFEVTKAMIESGAAGIHYEDQLSSEKKCGHLGGKVLVPTAQFVRSLVSARLASDVMGVETVIIARTDANGASLITSDIDPRDQKFITGERTREGFFRIQGGIDAAIARGVASAPYADMIWCETSRPDIEEARRFANGIHKAYPGKMLAYNCSPSFHWEKNLDQDAITRFQKELANMGYKFQFITLAGFHALNYSMFELASGYASEGMTAYVRLQRKEFESANEGYSAIKHQKFVGTEYFDQVSQVISGGFSSTTAMEGSTERAQFEAEKSRAEPLSAPRPQRK
jgi:isocitrate lyase